MGVVSLPRLIAGAALLAPAWAFAFHDVTAPAARVPAWNLEPWLVASLLGSALLYARGVAALWRKAGLGRGIRWADVARFASGWILLCTALVTPIDALAATSFAIHMVQHELLMVAAAPLLVLGRPLEAWAWALPADTVRGLGAATRSPGLRRAWRGLTDPVGAWCFHAAALWAWHLPIVFRAALADNGVHILQHTTFFASALAFWWAVFGRASRTADAISLVLVFTTMLHTGALGALLTFAPTPFYATGLAIPYGLTALEDQQLGGVVMWVPGGFAYLVAGLAIAARWLREEPPPPSRTADSPAPT